MHQIWIENKSNNPIFLHVYELNMVNAETVLEFEVSNNKSNIPPCI